LFGVFFETFFVLFSVLFVAVCIVALRNLFRTKVLCGLVFILHSIPFKCSTLWGKLWREIFRRRLGKQFRTDV